MIFYHRYDRITLDFYLSHIYHDTNNMIKRDILAKIMPWVGKEKILVLKGSRQVGKTTLLRQIESEIKGCQQTAVVAYLSADDRYKWEYASAVYAEKHGSLQVIVECVPYAKGQFLYFIEHSFDYTTFSFF